MDDTHDVVVCVCMAVTEAQLLEAVARGFHDLPALREATGANTGCGDCAEDIEELVEFAGEGIGG
ncbi:bacterioferritin-associated ferredoxin [Streptomyces sp. NPDC051243]|uniref:bacterioferritin-associated ferredoxin n=1 Tax=Streptomyces sp. NPDC051243 TaxID=3365646 RepID=UPI0037B8E72F